MSEDGDVHVDLSAVTRDQAAGLLRFAFHESEDKHGRKIRNVSVKLNGKLQALIKLGEHLGLFKAGAAGMEPPPDSEPPETVDPLRQDVLKRFAEAAEKWGPSRQQS